MIQINTTKVNLTANARKWGREIEFMIGLANASPELKNDLRRAIGNYGDARQRMGEEQVSQTLQDVIDVYEGMRQDDYDDIPF